MVASNPAALPSVLYYSLLEHYVRINRGFARCDYRIGGFRLVIKLKAFDFRNGVIAA